MGSHKVEVSLEKVPKLRWVDAAESLRIPPISAVARGRDRAVVSRSRIVELRPAEVAHLAERDHQVAGIVDRMPGRVRV